MRAPTCQLTSKLKRRREPFFRVVRTEMSDMDLANHSLKKKNRENIRCPLVIPDSRPDRFISYIWNLHFTSNK